MNLHIVRFHSPAVMPDITRLFILLMCAAIVWGCSSTTLIYPAPSQDGISYSAFNQEMQSFQLTVELADQRSYIARNIQVTRDSTSFLNVRTEVIMTIPTRLIKQFTMQERSTGHSKGFLIGAIVGGIGGIGISTILPYATSSLHYLLVGGIVGGGVLVGGLAGGAIGSLTGYTRNFVIAGDSLLVK